jgi:predicted metal-dependent hydrolase
MHDARYLKGIEHFNAREFFDAHEIWEELWNEEHGEAHNFVQGLIQFATVLHHFEAHNLKGAKILFDAGVDLLKPYGDFYWDLPVGKLIEDMSLCMRDLIPLKLDQLPGRYHPDKASFPVQIDPDRIPRIQLRTSTQ